MHVSEHGSHGGEVGGGGSSSELHERLRLLHLDPAVRLEDLRIHGSSRFPEQGWSQVLFVVVLESGQECRIMN